MLPKILRLRKYKESLFIFKCVLVLLVCQCFFMMHGQQGIANYKMDIVLDDEDKTINGTTVLTWKNISDQPISTLQLHLYYNAFKNNQSTFFTESSGRLGFLEDEDSCNWGWSEILSFSDDKGSELSKSYIQPDDDNALDQSVLEVQLDEAVLPGESQKFTFEWKAQIPKIMPRTGYNKDYIFMAQWFPKVGVLEPLGMRGREETGWNCHQYHSSGEYYSDFGDYEVKIDLPSKYIFGSTGVLQNKNAEGDRTIWHVKAENVIDFTWTASPHFCGIER